MRSDFPRWQSWHKRQAGIPVPGSIYTTLHHRHWPLHGVYRLLPEIRFKWGFAFEVAWKIKSGEEKQCNTYPFWLPFLPAIFYPVQRRQTQPTCTHTPEHAPHTPSRTWSSLLDQLYLLVPVTKTLLEGTSTGFSYSLSHRSATINVIRYINLTVHSLWALGCASLGSS